LNNPNISDPLATITQNITYKVIVTTAEGCSSTDSVTIKAFKGPDIYGPTAFTPNHDGKNDKFIPIPVGIKEIKYFKVYNRWGQIVFSTSKLHEGWDGRLKGIDLDSGVFVWMIQAVTDDNRIIFKRGTVTLIR
jgi:gliding motility-associated-like protein